MEPTSPPLEPTSPWSLQALGAYKPLDFGAYKPLEPTSPWSLQALGAYKPLEPTSPWSLQALGAYKPLEPTSPWSLQALGAYKLWSLQALGAYKPLEPTILQFGAYKPLGMRIIILLYWDKVGFVFYCIKSHVISLFVRWLRYLCHAISTLDMCSAVDTGA